MKTVQQLFPIAFLFLLSIPSPAQVKQFQGNWVKQGTTYDFAFDLYLRHTGGNQVEGVFNWRVVNYDENEPASQAYFVEKLGLWAKEFVRGTYDPKTRTYRLQGYKKEDPHLIIDLDHYNLSEDGNGDIGGKTRAGGGWDGRINGKPIRGDNA